MVKNCKCKTRVRNLSCSISGISILKNINFELNCGTFYVIVGPNGSGKSSLFRCLIGEIPFTGTLEFNEQKHRPKIGYVPQHLHIDPDNPLTVQDLIHITNLYIPIWLPSFFRNSKLQKIFRDALFAVRGDHLLNRKFNTLSGGEKKRVILALALSKNPDILLLDEPDAGVDKQGIQLFYDIISRLKSSHDVSILLASHHFEFIQPHADYVFILNQGKIIQQGNPEKISKNLLFI